MALYKMFMIMIIKNIYIRRLKARVTRRRSLVLNKQKRFQLSSELAVGRDCQMTAVKQAACSKAAVQQHQTTCRPDEF